MYIYIYIQRTQEVIQEKTHTNTDNTTHNNFNLKNIAF